VVGKVVNIASRCSGFLRKGFDNRTAGESDDPALLEAFTNAESDIAEAYEAREYGRALRRVMELADRANQYIDHHKPWAMAKDPEAAPRVQVVCTTGLETFRRLMIYLAPVLPRMAEKAEQYLGRRLVWSELGVPLFDQELGEFTPLMQRIDPKVVEKMVESNRVEAAPADPKTTKAPEPDTAYLDFRDFAKVELRVARIAAAEAVEGADKLLALTLDVGDLGTRTVFSGIKAAYDPATLVGRLTVLVANLAPRKMRFGVSEGMVLAAGEGDEGVYLLEPDSGARPGMRIT
jgi:methionyl-tRNA synthetase